MRIGDIVFLGCGLLFTLQGIAGLLAPAKVLTVNRWVANKLRRRSPAATFSGAPAIRSVAIFETAVGILMLATSFLTYTPE